VLPFLVVVTVVLAVCACLMDNQVMMERVSGTALDFLIVAAVSTVNVSAIANAIVPFLILVVSGLLWNVWCVLYLGKVSVDQTQTHASPFPFSRNEPKTNN
jgi:ESS family glutamate:Na+ symporter